MSTTGCALILRSQDSRGVWSAPSGRWAQEWPPRRGRDLGGRATVAAGVRRDLPSFCIRFFRIRMIFKQPLLAFNISHGSIGNVFHAISYEREIHLEGI